MHLRRFAAFFLGAWLAGSLLMTMVATHNLRAVDQLLTAPAAPAAKSISALGHVAARTLLRYQAAELNRSYFETWEWTQIGLGAVLFLVLRAGLGRPRPALALCGLMLLAVLVMRFALTPGIVRLGRVIDFIPLDQPSPERGRLWTFHVAYSAAEVVKVILGAVLFLALVRRSRKQPEPQAQKPKWVRAR